MPRRSIVRRWQWTMAVATISAILAELRHAPSSMSFRVCDAQFQARFVFRETLRDARVQIPAEIIEFRRGGECANFRERFRFEVQESEDHVGDLHAGVVDVVLHFDAAARRSAGCAPNVSPSTALRRWPMCAALLGLMLVCSTMHLRRVRRGDGGAFAASLFARGEKKRGAVEKQIQVAAAGNFHALDAVEFA